MAHAPSNIELDQFSEAEAEDHAELLARNIFNITLVGVVAFISGCWFLMVH